MKSGKIEKLNLAAMFAALSFVATYFFKVPSINNGYIHLGDCMVLLGGMILGPVYGALAGGIGSMLSDLLGGYVSYIPATFITKALAALVCGLIFKYIGKKGTTAARRSLLSILSGILAGVIIVLGYLFYESVILGLGGGAIAGVPGNIVQAAAGILLSTLLYPVLYKIPMIREINTLK